MNIGEKYNYWTIINTAPSRHKHKYWLCQCDCGTIREVLGTDLKNNKSKSCGCIKSKNQSKNFKNEIGNKYGRLTILKRAKNTSDGRAQWLCECECGNKIIVKGSSLRNGATKSCGCYQKEQTSKTNTINLIGKTINNFTVLESIQGTKTNHHSWRCRCNLCGSEDNIITTTNLYNQYSCGCQTDSKGSCKIKEILNQNNISFITEKRFANCKFGDNNKTQARFDFYLPDYNCLIEYDGRQHFIQGNGNFDNTKKFKQTQEHDNYKNKWCKENNFLLIRIPYTYYEKITLKDLLPKTSNFLIN